MFMIIGAAAIAMPVALMAQPAGDEPEPTVNLDAIDAMLGGSRVTGGEAVADSAPVDDAAAEDEAVAEVATGDENALVDGSGAEGEIVSEQNRDEPSDLDRAYADYSLCASEAGIELEGSGFALDVIGQEALLRCAGPRSAYVNAFYFSLLPRYPGEEEGVVRGHAERLVAQTDSFIVAKVGEETAQLRAARPADEEAISE